MDARPAPPVDGPHGVHGGLGALTLGALGIVFGDIGTSPLYTLNECLHGEHGAGNSTAGVLGVLSLIAFDLPFFAANLFKFVEGGYVPIGIAGIVCGLMLIWNRGRRLLDERLEQLSTTREKFLDGLDARLLGRLPETTVFLAGSYERVPRSLHQYASGMRVLGEKVVIVTVKTMHSPYVEGPERVEVTPLDESAGVYRVVGHVGFMEESDVPSILALAKAEHGLPIDLEKLTYVVGRDRLIATDAGKMGGVTETIFSFMLRNARSASDYFCLPPDKVIELGTQIDL